MVSSKLLTCLMAAAVFMLAQGAGAVGFPGVPNTHFSPHNKMAPDHTNLGEAFANGKLDFWTRLRFEDVEDDFPPGHALHHTNDADALAWRTAIGYTTGRYHGWYARLEAEFNRILGSDRALNIDGDVELGPPQSKFRGRGLLPQNRAAEGHAIIPDNDFEEINEAYIGWRSPSGGCPNSPDPCDGTFSFKLGRQTVIYDNHRWVGDVIWRNNNVSFDALRVDKSFKNLGLSYTHVDKVKRLFGEDSEFHEWDMDDSHLINVSYKIPGVGKLVAYGYLLDFNDNRRTPFVEGTGTHAPATVTPASLAALKQRITDGEPGTTVLPNGSTLSAAIAMQTLGLNVRAVSRNLFDSDTYGVRFTGRHEISDSLDFLTEFEWANQDPSNDADDALDDNDYYNIELGVRFGGTRVDNIGFLPVGEPTYQIRVGHEVLEGNGVNALQTPLATVHAFNGWADKFVGGPGGTQTPPGGIEDTSVTLQILGLFGNVIGKNKIVVNYHDYSTNKSYMQGANRISDYGDEWGVLWGKPIGKKLLLALKYADFDSEDGFSTDTQKFWAFLKYRWK